MISSPPKFRRDLTIQQQQTAGESSFVIKDPVSGDFFRFREVEEFITQQLDGETPLQVVRQRSEENFGATLSDETLNAFIKSLEKTGLLETEETSKEQSARRRRRMRGGLLHLRFKILDPNRLLDRMVHRLGFFFTPHFVVVSAVLILLGVGTTIANWSQFTQDLSQLYRLSSIPLFLMVIFLVGSAHEFAHGLTCKHFGGEIHEMGFYLIYFQPALYCNVSDAWLFPEKSKRLWVGFAGPYFELFLWALAALAWRATDVETWINYLALIVMISSGMKILLNFIPLIKLDGYYLLSDYLEIPNLRRKSFRHVGNLTKRLFGLSSQTKKTVSRRERRIFLTYGLLATAGSLCLLGYVIVTVGGYLIDTGQSTVLMLFSGLLGVKFRRRSRKLFGSTSPSSDHSDDGDVFGTSGSTVMPRVVPKAAKPRKKKRGPWLRRILWLALAGTMLAALFVGHMELRIAGPFNVLPRENADIRSAVEGIVEKIYVDEGDQVKAGDVIARLSDRDLLVSLRQNEAQIRETSANLKKLEAGPRAEEIEVATGAVSKAEDRVKYAQARLARLKSLFEEKLLSRNDFETTQELVTVYGNDLTDARNRLNLLLSGSRPEEIDAMRAQIEALETQRLHLKGQLRLLNVVSPETGIVATPSRQLMQMKHQLIKKGDLIAKVYDFKTVTAQILISEKEIEGIEEGQRVELRARAYPSEAFFGRVTSIATSAQGSSSPGGQTLLGTTSASSSASSDKTIIVTTEIENQSLLLKPELTGQAKIFCGERRILDLLTRRLSRTIKVDLWSWW